MEACGTQETTSTTMNIADRTLKEINASTQHNEDQGYCCPGHPSHQCAQVPSLDWRLRFALTASNRYESVRRNMVSWAPPLFIADASRETEPDICCMSCFSSINLSWLKCTPPTSHVKLK